MNKPKKNKFERNVWYVLFKINEQLSHTEDGKTISTKLYGSVGNDIIDLIEDEEASVLQYLRAKNAILIQRPYDKFAHEFANADVEHDDKSGQTSMLISPHTPSFVRIEILQPTFDRMFAEYESLGIPIPTKKISSTPQKTRFTLEENGTLTRHDGDGKVTGKHVFQKGAKLEILKGLAELPHHIDTSRFANDHGWKHGGEYVRRMVGELRRDIAESFKGLAGDDFIPKSKKDGYRLEKNIHIDLIG